MVTNLTARCTRAGAEALQYGLARAADPVGTCHAGALLLRGSPSLLGWLAGWVSAEFPLPALAGHALSRVSPPSVSRIATAWAAQCADRILTEALGEALGADYGDRVRHPGGADPGVRRCGGMVHTARRRRVYAAQTSNIAYGPGGRDHLLDVWRPPDSPASGACPRPAGARAPVLVQVPGGAWSINDKRGQAYPLMSHMVELGWICVSINYAKSPRRAWPAHIVDVKRAIAWVRDNIADYGGDPDFIAITGGSAGAHLSALAALSANDPQLQPGFEAADTTVQAAVPYYGVYDLTDAASMNALMMPFLERFVMQARYADDPALFAAASPISHVHAGAPPFFVLHGANDAVIPSAQAQRFCAALRGANAATVGYAHIPNAHHAFDAIATIRSQIAADAVADFLGVVYGRHVGALKPARTHPVRANSAG